MNADRFSPVRARVDALGARWWGPRDLAARGIDGPDAEFIVNARMDVVDLLNEVDRLRSADRPC